MNARWRWRALTALPWALALAALVGWWLYGPWPALRNGPPPAPASPAAGASPQASPPAHVPLPSSAASTTTGGTHSLAMSDLVARAKGTAQLSPTDIQSLLTFISSPKPVDLTDGEWEERVNGVLNLLRRQSEAPGLTDFLLATAENHPSRVLRLYALQHLSLWYARESNAKAKARIVRLLETLATRDGEATAGCALLMLGDIQREATKGDTTVIDESVLSKSACRLLADTAAPQDARISAIHACVDRKDPAPLPDLRVIAADKSLVGPLRKAAIHAIGQLGGPEDMELLDSLPQDDGNLSLAVLPARKALAGRLAGSGAGTGE